MAKRGRPRKTPVYLTSEQIYLEWFKWRETNKITEKMGEYMLLLAKHMLMMPQFNGYPESMKQEMAQEACMKIIKNLKNMNEDKKDGFFSYWSCVCYTSFVTYLRKHYEHVNKKRQFFLDVLQYAKDRGLSKVRPDTMAELQRQVIFYNNERKNDGTNQND